jgi:hypothetical protein
MYFGYFATSRYGFLIYIMSEVLGQYPMTPLYTALRFGMKRSRLNFLDLKDLAGVNETLH